MTKIKGLKDKNNKVIYPMAEAEDVYMPDGQIVKVVIENLSDKVVTLDTITKESATIAVNSIIL